MTAGPLFIVFEGIDGSGKSTQARLLAEALREKGIPCLLTFEPSDGPVGLKIRALTGRAAPEEEARMFTEDRRDHLDRVIAPALEQGVTVICDRYVYSSVAYQGARGLDPDGILARNREFARSSDITFLLEISVEEALARIDSGREGAVTPFETREQLEAVEAVYNSLQDPDIQRVKSVASVEEVHERIKTILREKGLMDL